MNGTINLKKLSTKMLDAISTLNTRVDAVPSQIKTNNRQTLATVEQNAEAASRAYTTGEYLAVNGKLYKVLNNIAQGDALQENVNIEWVLLGDEVNKIRNDLKQGAFRDVANNLTTGFAGGNVLDAYQGKLLNDKITTLNNTLNNKTTVSTGTITLNNQFINKYKIGHIYNVVRTYGRIVNFNFSVDVNGIIPSGETVLLGTISPKPVFDQFYILTTSNPSTTNVPYTFAIFLRPSGSIELYRYDSRPTSSTGTMGWLRFANSYISQ